MPILTIKEILYLHLLNYKKSYHKLGGGKYYLQIFISYFHIYRPPKPSYKRVRIRCYDVLCFLIFRYVVSCFQQYCQVASLLFYFVVSLLIV